MEDRPGDSGFLPPEPAGPEPDLEQPPAPQPPTPPQAPPPQAQQAWTPPPPGQPAWGQPPPPAWPPQQHHQQQQQWAPPPQQPGWGSPPTWGPQPGWGAPPGAPAPVPWATARPKEPDNGPAVAGFTLAMIGGGLLLVSAGLSSVVSLVCSALAIFYSRRGRQRVDRGETPKHRGLAQAGFVTGIIGTVLAALATAFWALVIVLYASDEDFRRDFDNEFDNSDSISAAVILARGALLLLS